MFWHTQGSGKSLSMVFYAHLLQEALDSPTIVVMTDRIDLDDQLYAQFAKCAFFSPPDAGTGAKQGAFKGAAGGAHCERHYFYHYV